MASTREREGKFTGLYRDRAGHQRSAGTYTTKREALKAARHAEALEAQGRDAANAMRGPKYAYSIFRHSVGAPSRQQECPYSVGRSEVETLTSASPGLRTCAMRRA